MAAETSIQKARRLAKERRERGEAEKAREDAAKVEAAKPKKEKKERSLIDRIRDAFSSEDDINRIDSALEAVERGVDDADKDAKRKK